MWYFHPSITILRQVEIKSCQSARSKTAACFHNIDLIDPLCLSYVDFKFIKFPLINKMPIKMWYFHPSFFVKLKLILWHCARSILLFVYTNIYFTDVCLCYVDFIKFLKRPVIDNMQIGMWYFHTMFFSSSLNQFFDSLQGPILLFVYIYTNVDLTDPIC